MSGRANMGWLVKACFLLTTTLFVIGSAVIGIARLTSHSPLALYEASIAGQSMTALKHYSCLLRFSETNTTASVLCEFTSPQGAFDDSPMQTVVVQSGHLRLGDLFVCLGVPTGVQHISLVQTANLVNLVWDDPAADSFSNPDRKQLDDFLPISYLSIEGKASLCRSA